MGQTRSSTDTGNLGRSNTKASDQFLVDNSSILELLLSTEHLICQPSGIPSSETEPQKERPNDLEASLDHEGLRNDQDVQEICKSE